MPPISLVQLITADALRAAIRAVGLLGDIQRSAQSLPRALLGSNAVEPLCRELGRLRGLGDLLTPVSTSAESQIRTERLDGLFALVPQTPSPDWQGHALPAQGHALHTQKGALLAADEMALRGLEEKICRQLGLVGEPPEGQLQAQSQVALNLLHEESSSWRLLENSRLANRLIGDHGFAETYAQARKRVRLLVKQQASKGRSRPKASDMRSFKRWHDALTVQLDALGMAHELDPQLQALLDQCRMLGVQVDDWLSGVRVRSALNGAGLWEDSSEAALDELSAAVLVSLQRSYGLGKSNFRQLVESELAL